MTFRPLVYVVLPLALWGASAPPVHAHHGPPHDEIDEFDTPAARLAFPVPAGGVSWPAILVSLAGVSAVFIASRKWGVDAAVPAPVRVRR